jgi:hypothetical protein
MTHYLGYLLFIIIIYNSLLGYKEPLKMKLICKKSSSQEDTDDNVLSCTYDDYMSDLKNELNNNKAYLVYKELKDTYAKHLSLIQ